MKQNILFITLDQFRGDSLSCAGHPLVQTPHLDMLASHGVRFARHYSQASPCAPGRASLYTGMYQMNHRVVANGTPLDSSFDNIALAARRAGYTPTLFGYTDQSVDPRESTGPDDDRLNTYEGVLPGFDIGLDLTRQYTQWRAFLTHNGFNGDAPLMQLLATEHERPVAVSCSSFLADELLQWVDKQDGSWFAHASFIRPHPPYSAAGEYGAMYSPADVGEPIQRAEHVHPFHELMLSIDSTKAPSDKDELAHMRAQYFGMISEVDFHVGRIIAALQASGAWDNTVIVVTADHAELLGDHGLREKLGYWETSQHILSIVRDPHHAEQHGTVVEHFTENVDFMPTLCDFMNVPVPLQCDGVSLMPFLHGEDVDSWRDAAYWEYDWRFALIPYDKPEWQHSRRLEKMSLCVRRNQTHAYVQFGDGDFLCFDIAADPSWRTTTQDAEIISREARAMLTWRMEHANRTNTGFLAENGGVGRWPDGVAWRQEN